MKKTNRLITSALLFSALLTGCKGESEVPVDIDNPTSGLSEYSESYSPFNIDRTSAESVATGFINAIKNADFTTAKSLININDGTYLNAEDLEYVVRRSLIGHMIGQPNAYTTTPNFTEHAGTASYSFYIDDSYNLQSYYQIDLELDESNNWCITKENFVKDTVVFYVPEGVRFYLNDIEIGNMYKVRTENSVDIYRVPEVARRTFKTTIVSSVFGSITGELSIPMYDQFKEETYKEGDPIEVNRIITSELLEELGERTQFMYNQIYEMMDSELSAENLNQYITSEKNYKFLEQYYNNGVNVRKSVSLDDTSHRYTNTEILEFWQNPSVPSYVYSTDTIVINIILSLRWVREGKVVESSKLSAGVKLTKTPGGEWLLNDITPGAWTNLTNGLDESNGVNAW